MLVNCAVKFEMEYIPFRKRGYVKQMYLKENCLAVDMFNKHIGEVNAEFDELYGDLDTSDVNSPEFKFYCRFVAIHINPYLGQLNTKLRWRVDADNSCTLAASLPNYPKSKCIALIKDIDM